MDQDELESSLKAYQPNAGVLRGVANLRLLATVGPTSSGKTVVAKKMVDDSDEVHFVLGETSRKPRPGEQNAVDYLFRERAEIIEDLKNGRLVDVVIGPNGDLYSTRLNSYSPKGINVMALIPSAVLKYRQLPLKNFRAAFIVPESYERWQEWLAERARHSKWTRRQLLGRLAEARKSYEFALADGDTNFILNDQIDAAAKRLMQVADNQIPDDESTARSIAESNLSKLVKNLAANSVN